MVTAPKGAVQLPKHKPLDVYHEGMGDAEPRERHAYVRPRIALRLPVSKYPTRTDAGREGKRRLGDMFRRVKFFYTARYWVFHVYE